MDLLQSVRKEGSRGGVNFSWDDVKSSQHRENYLGHSLMAPVGRWQKGKDLSWYAKAEDAELTPEQRKEKEELERKEERRKIKEAEEDAMARALGLPVPDRSNANLEPLGMSEEKGKMLKDALKDGEAEGRGEETRSGTMSARASGEGGRGPGQEMEIGTEGIGITTVLAPSHGTDEEGHAAGTKRRTVTGEGGIETTIIAPGAMQTIGSTGKVGVDRALRTGGEAMETRDERSISRSQTISQNAHFKSSNLARTC